MTGIKSLIGKKMVKEIPFMGEKITINKLSVAQVLEIQQKSAEVAKAGEVEANDQSGLEAIRTVMCYAVDGADEISEEDFNSFPIDELIKASGEIMKFSGISGDDGKGK
jgi:hypothetical protein